MAKYAPNGIRKGFVPPSEKSAAVVKQAIAEQKQTLAQLAMLERVQTAQKARSDLLVFTKFTSPDPEDPDDLTKSLYEDAKFHRLVAGELDRFLRGEMLFDDGRVCTQLIFCMPPRHGKSELATRRLTAQYSGNNPRHDVIVAAAGDDLAGDFGADVRAIMSTPQYKQVFPGHKLRRGGTAKDNIQTVEGGRLIFAGRGGQINGRGAHLLLIDDLYKDDKEAKSQTIRDDAWNWLTRVALKRRMGKRLTIITMTRWHSDDIIGRLTDPKNDQYNKEEAKNWKIIRLPGLAEADDPLGRRPGEALWPEKRRDGTCYDEEYHLADQRRDPLGFAALTQQRPTVADGVLFQRKHVRYYLPEDLPKELRYYCASDHAVSLEQRADSTVLLKVGVDAHNNIYVLDCWWDKQPTDVVVGAMLTMGTGARAPLIWWAEKGHISKSIGPFLRKRMMETQTYFNIREVTPVADKQQRAQSIQGRMAMGHVWWPKSAIWTEQAIDQLLAFPNDNHDDFVDAFAYIGLGLQSQVAAAAPKVVNKEPTFGTLGWVKRHDKWLEQRRQAAQRGGF